MHLYKTIQNFLYDKDYFIDMWEDFIHVYGFIDIEVLKEDKITLVLPQSKIFLQGHSFRVIKLTKKEILIEGVLTEMRKQNDMA